MLSIDKNSFKRDYNNKFVQLHGKELKEGNNQQKYEALGSLVRDYVISTWMDTNNRYNQTGEKQVYYFSMEFLLGRLLGDFLLNLGIRDICKEALNELDIDLEEIENLEHDQGLGNGGLGRLAACFLDSMASLNIAGHGCGIRYKYGFFEQKIVDCQQVEASDNWLREGNVWEIKKQDKAEIVKFGGSIISDYVNGKLTFTHVNYEPVLAVPYDTPIVGYENEVVNTLRLWSAEPVSNEFDFSSFSRGDFLKAISYKNSVEAISLVLYPEDSFYEGKMLRLKQQYFFVSAGIQSIVRHYKKHKGDIKLLDEKIAIHINDTHPTLAIPELMRILLDEEGLSWENAWRITQNTISYTNHTILAEALEKWPVDMFKSLLPRIYMIIEEINRRYCEELWNKYLGQWDKISRMAIIGDGYVRMANLAIVGSHSVNGVAKLHTEILKKREMSDFYYLYPSKFNNKTNGITHRRWLIRSNPKLTKLLVDTIGDSFIKHPTDLENFKNDYYIDNNQLRKELKLGEEDLVMICGAMLRREKNHIQILKYIKSLVDSGYKNIKVLLLGDGIERHNIEEFIKENKLDNNVILLGLQKDVKKYYSISDIGVIGSKAVETFSIAALEQMSMGVPMIMTNIGGANEMIIDGFNGYLYELDDDTAFINIVKNIYKEKSTLKKLKTNARTLVKNNFCQEKMIDKYVNIINN